MDGYGIIVTMPDLDQLRGNKAIEVLHDHADEIARDILENIENRTPVDTGALKEDESYELGQGNNLVRWFVGSEYQTTENKRYYAPYQEGPSLGLRTYTEGEHQMFFRVTTDDLPLIAAWAQQTVDDATEGMANAAAAGATTWEMP